MSAWSQLEQLLTCAICLDRFRNPKLLPCQHTFCGEPCMEGLVDYARRQIKCPECRAEHRIPYNGVQSFPNNVTLTRFLDLHRGITGEEPEPLPSQMDRCGVCGEKSFCLRCAHCEKKVCEECRSAHLDILRREINRINTQVRRSLTKLAEQTAQTGKSSERLAVVSSQIRDEITESVRRFIKDLKDKEAKLLADLDEFTESESKNSEKLTDDLDLELATITSNCELVEEHVTEADEWTDVELMEYKDIFMKTLDFLRNLDPDTMDLSRKIKFVQKVDLDAMRRNAADFGEIKITAPAANLLSSGLLSPSDSSSNLMVPGSNLMRSQSDHRLAAQFANSGSSGRSSAKDALQRSYLDVTGGSSGRYGSDSDRERGGSPPGRRGERFGSVRSYGARGSELSYTRGWERPSDSTAASAADYEPSNSSNFRSRFMRERMRGGGAGGDDHSFEDGHDDVPSHRVRFQEEAGGGNGGGGGGSSARTKLFDTEEMAALRAPLSGIIKLVDSPFVMERVHQNGVKAKQKEQEAKESGNAPASSLPSSAPTPVMPVTPPRPTRQVSEDEIEKQKKANKAEAAASAAKTGTPAPKTTTSSGAASAGSLAVESSVSSRTSPSSTTTSSSVAATTAAASNRRVQALQKEDTRASVRSSASSDDGSEGGADSGDVTNDDDSTSAAATAAAAASAASSASRRRIYASSHGGGGSTTTTSNGAGAAAVAGSGVDYSTAETTAGRSSALAKQGPAGSSTNRQVPTTSSTSTSSTSANTTSTSTTKYSSPSTNNTSSSKSSNRRAKAKDTNNNYTDPLYDISSSSYTTPSSTSQPSSSTARSLFSPTRSTTATNSSGVNSSLSSYSTPSSYHSPSSANHLTDYSSTNRSTALHPLSSPSSSSAYSSPYSSSTTSSSSTSAKSKYSGGGGGGSGSAISDYLLGSDLLDRDITSSSPSSSSHNWATAYDPYSSSTTPSSRLNSSSSSAHYNFDNPSTKSPSSNSAALLSSYGSSSSSPAARHLNTSSSISSSAMPSSATAAAAHSSSLSNLPTFTAPTNSPNLPNWRGGGDHASVSPSPSVITSSAMCLDPSSGASFMPPGANLAIAPAIGSTAAAAAAAAAPNQSTEPLILPNALPMITTDDDIVVFVSTTVVPHSSLASTSKRRKRAQAAAAAAATLAAASAEPPVAATAASPVISASVQPAQAKEHSRGVDHTTSSDDHATAKTPAKDQERSSSSRKDSVDEDEEQPASKVVEPQSSGSSAQAAASAANRRKVIRIKARQQASAGVPSGERSTPSDNAFSPREKPTYRNVSGSHYAGSVPGHSSSTSASTTTSNNTGTSYNNSSSSSTYRPSHSYTPSSYRPSASSSLGSSYGFPNTIISNSNSSSTSSPHTASALTSTSATSNRSSSPPSALNRSNAYLSSARAQTLSSGSGGSGGGASSTSATTGNYRHNLSSMGLPGTSSNSSSISSSSNVTQLMRAIVSCSRLSSSPLPSPPTTANTTTTRSGLIRKGARNLLEVADTATFSLLWFFCEATLMVTLVSLTLITVTVPDSISPCLTNQYGGAWFLRPSNSGRAVAEHREHQSEDGVEHQEQMSAEENSIGQ